MGQFREALVQYRQLLTMRGAPPRALMEIARLELLRNLEGDRGGWGAVDRALAEAERLRPLPEDVVLMRVDALAAQSQELAAQKQEAAAKQAKEMKDLARGYLAWSLVAPQTLVFGALRPELIATSLALEKVKPHAAYWRALAALEEQEGKPAVALALLDEAERRYGDSPETRLARLRYWLRQKGRQPREALSGLAKVARGSTSSTRMRRSSCTPPSPALTPSSTKTLRQGTTGPRWPRSARTTSRAGWPCSTWPSAPTTTRACAAPSRKSRASRGPKGPCGATARFAVT